MSIFIERKTLKPVEYPDVNQYKAAIRHSYWVHTEFSFTRDIHDYSGLPDKEKSLIKNAMLAISQIEVDVKRFWADIGKLLPKPEINGVGITFGESEERHSDAYSHLLEKLCLNSEFDRLLEVSCIRGRIDYLQKYLKFEANTPQLILKKIILFSIFVEYVSLFGQFLIIRSFYHNKSILKDIDNVVQATLKEELTHAYFGAWLVNQIRTEHPELFTAELVKEIDEATLAATFAELLIIDWLFEAGDTSVIDKNTVKGFIMSRFDDGRELCGLPRMYGPQFSPDHIKWFYEEMHSEVNTDFFHKKPTTYSKHTKPINESELF